MTRLANVNVHQQAFVRYVNVKLILNQHIISRKSSESCNVITVRSQIKLSNVIYYLVSR